MIILQPTPDKRVTILDTKTGTNDFRQFKYVTEDGNKCSRYFKFVRDNTAANVISEQYNYISIHQKIFAA